MNSSDRDIEIFFSLCEERRMDSHALLRKAAARYTGRSPCVYRICREEKGKPWFEGAPMVRFNITHSGAYWMCAFSRRAVGLDLQVHQSCDRARLSQRFLHPQENAFLKRGGYEDFFDLWAAKESYLKYTGQGITDELSRFSLVQADGVFPAAENAQLLLLPWEEGYSMCLCAESIGAVTIKELEA